MSERTHWDGCWREHHDCAVVEIERLQTQLADVQRERERDLCYVIEACRPSTEAAFNVCLAALARLRLAQEWIEGADHQEDCTAIDGVSFEFREGLCTCGRDALLNAIKEPT